MRQHLHLARPQRTGLPPLLLVLPHQLVVSLVQPQLPLLLVLPPEPLSLLLPLAFQPHLPSVLLLHPLLGPLRLLLHLHLDPPLAPQPQLARLVLHLPHQLLGPPRRAQAFLSVPQSPPLPRSELRQVCLVPLRLLRLACLVLHLLQLPLEPPPPPLPLVPQPLQPVASLAQRLLLLRLQVAISSPAHRLQRLLHRRLALQLHLSAQRALPTHSLARPQAAV